MKKTRSPPSVDWLQGRAEEILSDRDEGRVEEGLRTVIRFYEPLNYNISYGAPLWRGRKCNNRDGYEYFSEIHYPPVGSAKAGRVNDPGSPLLYLSFTQFTALAEIQATFGETIHVVGYSMRDDHPIRSLTLGEFANVHLRGQGVLPGNANEQINNILARLNFEEGLSFVFLDSFLAAVMASQEAEAVNYMHSRVLARLFFEKYPGISAIHYPSVARGGAMNLAIKPAVADKALDVAGTSVLSIDKRFDYGLYRFSVLRNSTQVYEDGSIKWEEEF